MDDQQARRVSRPATPEELAKLGRYRAQVEQDLPECAIDKLASFLKHELRPIG
jgi:hypothetical protein